MPCSLKGCFSNFISVTKSANSIISFEAPLPVNTTWFILFLKDLDMNKNLCHVILTGRGASKKIIEFADLVTEMKLIKHPFREQGIKAQECVEYWNNFYKFYFLFN